MKIKRLTSVLLGMILALSLAACGADAGAQGTTDSSTEVGSDKAKTEIAEDNKEQVTEPEPEQESNEEPVQISDASADGTEVLVVYFSATGTTKGVAEKIAGIENADIYEIVPKEPYSDADLNWNDKESRTTKEQNDKSVRPEIGSDVIDLSGYSRIYIGYPIWWGEEPRILDTFVESYDFENATMIPFCTSGGSGIGSSGKNLSENAGSGNWIDGERLNGNISEEELKSWIDGL